jgi:hypothetical protein
MGIGTGRSVEDGLAIGRKLMAARDYKRAVQCHRLLAIRFPWDSRVYMALGQSLRGRGNQARMTRAFRRAIVLQPEVVELYYNFGNAERSFDNAGSAVGIYRKALCLAPRKPEVETAVSLALLQMGDWSAAWPLYEMRESCREFNAQMRALGHDIWDGNLIRGHRILLVAEQGAGDAIQFIRYARLLADAGMIVQVHCQPALERLFAAVPWIESVSTVNQSGFDSSCLIMSLPYRFKTEPISIPNEVPYLRPLETTAGPKSIRTVGLVWAGTPKNSRDGWRSCPRGVLSPLLEVPGLSFQSLQPGWIPGPGTPPWSDVAPLDEGVTDYADTAKIIANLDLVISVDTSVAHLAGALGKPVWMLLGRHSDWRWLLDRDDTPWYPTMRLFRMGETDGPGNDRESWINLLAKVAEELSIFAEQASE